MEQVAEAFAKVSCEYERIKLDKLPSYLPAEQSPQLHVYQVYKKIQNQKRTKSTLPIDIPASLRKEAAEFLAEPLTDIFNSSLENGTYPKIWKNEWVTPVPKGKPNQILKTLKDVRKIASTSDYSKIFEAFILELIYEDISDKLSPRQYGGKKGIGAEHLIVTMIDQIRKYQDDPEKLAVILNSYDWSSAFDKLDPTIVAVKCINLGIRSSLVNILIDFMNERKMQIKMNKHTSTSHDLIGGGPQGSLIGQLLYIIGSDDVAHEVQEEDKFKYIDDLAVIEAVKARDKLEEYDLWNHVPSDIAIDEKFLPPDSINSQSINDSVATWTRTNLMKLNENKSKYMVLTKSKDRFATRLSVNNQTIDKTNEMVHLGVWISEDLTWNKHISELCKRAYPRVKILTRLKYVGTSEDDLIELYCLLIRCLTEYCSVAFHSSLSIPLSNKIEAIQKTSLRVILGVMYVDYQSALEMCGLDTLYARRENRSLHFAINCTHHKPNKSMFPLNPSTYTHNMRRREKYKVNMAHTELYRSSTIPYLQRRLNDHYNELEEKRLSGLKGA